MSDPLKVISVEGGFIPIFPGDKLFDLKAAHGMPLDFALDRIINEGGFAVDWVGFVDTARLNGWWDFQTYKSICSSMEDAMLPRTTQAGIKERLRLYILSKPHPLRVAP